MGNAHTAYVYLIFLLTWIHFLKHAPRGTLHDTYMKLCVRNCDNILDKQK